MNLNTYSEYFQKRYSLIFSSNLEEAQFLKNSICENKIGKFEPIDILDLFKEIKIPYETNIINKKDIFNYTPTKIKGIGEQKNNNEDSSNQKCESTDINFSHSNKKSISPFTLLKKKRFITTEKTHLPQSNINFQNSKYKIIINKMVKRLIEENLLNEINNKANSLNEDNKKYELNYNQNIFRRKTNNENTNFEEFNNSKSLNFSFLNKINEDNIINQNFQNKFLKKQNLNYFLKNIYFEETKIPNIKYNYLLNDFNDEIDNSFSFNDTILLTKYKQSKMKKNQTNNKIDFGENPVESFIGWLNWLNNELNKEKNDQTNQICEDISKTMNSITSIMSTFPILLYPKSGKYENITLFNKITKKKKEINDNTENKIDDKKFICDICNEVFTSGQGLGGHMSRKHKDQSMKFKHKKEIRNKREPLRNILVQAKKILCKNHLIDYDEQIRSREGKTLIKSLVKEYNEEFKKIKNELKKKILIK